MFFRGWKFNVLSLHNDEPFRSANVQLSSVWNESSTYVWQVTGGGSAFVHVNILQQFNSNRAGGGSAQYERKKKQFSEEQQQLSASLMV